MTVSGARVDLLTLINVVALVASGGEVCTTSTRGGLQSIVVDPCLGIETAIQNGKTEIPEDALCTDSLTTGIQPVQEIAVPVVIVKHMRPCTMRGPLPRPFMGSGIVGITVRSDEMASEVCCTTARFMTIDLGPLEYDVSRETGVASRYQEQLRTTLKRFPFMRKSIGNFTPSSLL